MANDFIIEALTGVYNATGATADLRATLNRKLVTTKGEFSLVGATAELYKGADAVGISTPPAKLGKPTRFIPILTAEILSQVAGPISVESATPMRVRKLDKNGDMSFGHGQSDFWRNVPDAPAQCAYTRLVFWKGEWFLDLEDGTDWNQKVLGKHTQTTRDPEIIFRVSLTKGVNEVKNYYSALNRDTREFGVNITVDTIYGEATIQGPI